jgi:hypothetical protein
MLHQRVSTGAGFFGVGQDDDLLDHAAYPD